MFGITNAQQGNHLVVQGYMEHLDTRVEPYEEALKKTVYYDIDFNKPEIDINKIKSKRIIYTNKTDSLNSIFNVMSGKFSPGYTTISNYKGDLLAFTYNNILYNSSGDSIDYISQYCGRKGILPVVGLSDTFTIYYIGTSNEFNAITFEYQFYKKHVEWNPPYENDSFFLFELNYIGNKRISKKRVKGFSQFGNPSLLQSNLIYICTPSKEKKIQFVWDSYLIDINISNDYEIKKIKLINDKPNNRNFKEYRIWDDYIILGQTVPTLVASPSGRWTVYNWVYFYGDNTDTKLRFNVSRVFLIDNKFLGEYKEIFSDSSNYDEGEISVWGNAVFTNKDSTFLIPKTKLIFNGQGNNVILIELKRGIIEVKISHTKIQYQHYKVFLKNTYTMSTSRSVLKDIILAPDGKNYAFVKRYVNSESAMGSNIIYRQFEIAELTKIDSYFTITKPINVITGVGLNNKAQIRGDVDEEIYFPATPIPYHYINFTNKSICNDLTHEFTNETDTNWFDHFMWFWGDGDSTASHKSQPIVRHQYPKPGKYRVNLKSITAHGGWVWYSDSVEVLPEPIAKYQTKNTVGCQWIAVRFNDSSVLQKKNHTWYWDFGDGNDTIMQSSNGIMPSQKRIEHTYSTSGKFNVQLRITDGRCTDTFSTTQNIDILPAPRPGISIDKTTGCTPLEVRFARTYSDQTDSTIYHFKPAMNPKNRFNGSQNTALISKSGPYILHQKLYGPSGCVTEDSVSLQITQGILPNTKPHLKRSTVVNNRTVLTEWNPVPHAKDYQVYRNGQPHAVATDTQFVDRLNRDIDRTYIYEIIAKDSCGNLASEKSNIGKPIFLQVKQIEPASKSEFATALLTWTPYEDWSNSGGVENYSIFGNYAIESQSWQLLKNQTDTQLHDPDFIAPPNYEKCYRINSKSLDGRYQTQSNVACLDFPATLFAPNSFTPNGDGLNDAFEIFNYGFDRFTMTIYNSWGQKVFDQNGPTATWHPSKDIPQGVYVYQIKAVRNEKEFNFSGTVSLLR